MTRSEVVLDLVCYVVPSIALFASVYIFTNKWDEIQREKLKTQRALGSKQDSASNQPVVNENKKLYFPMQVDAYQRIVLFLERISPNNMVMRLNNPALPARVFQQILLDNIRSEYEHNLAQQIFISQDAWHLAKNSKDETIKIINMAATNLPPTAMCLDLSRAIFEITAQLNNQPTDRAIMYLKGELNKIVNG
ncbi:MAG: hypothetical protein IPO32_05315 [Crocinitomicaceae bacterium]|nr:hypothetical protein [Crocinitomicaceae bacterium]MBK6951954.1 hypothetical protein [Crocinitomicaceae bacterium]MBK9590937.1 hypothetical protein [Crocinitomicaceae bacterium]